LASLPPEALPGFADASQSRFGALIRPFDRSWCVARVRPEQRLNVWRVSAARVPRHPAGRVGPDELQCVHMAIDASSPANTCRTHQPCTSMTSRRSLRIASRFRSSSAPVTHRTLFGRCDRQARDHAVRRRGGTDQQRTEVPFRRRPGHRNVSAETPACGYATRRCRSSLAETFPRKRPPVDRHW